MNFQSKKRLLCHWWGAMLLCLVMIIAAFPSLVLGSAVKSPLATGTTRAEISWDTWGVPHIFAKDNAGLFRAFGWAQMENHADLLLRLYGQARGRAAEYWGQQYLQSDETTRLFAFPQKAYEWYAKQSPEMQTDLNAFATGINAYARAHLNRIAKDVRVVLPVSSFDVLAHTLRVFYFFLGGPVLGQGAGCLGVAPAGTPFGSNGWAIGPGHSTGGKAMLLANPHLPWSDLFTWMEAQLTAPGINAYGATLVGLPMLGIAFNDYLGWTHTVNTMHGCTVYGLTPSGKGYLFDGKVRSFTTRTEVIKVRQANGTLRSISEIFRRAIQGPVVESKGHLYALRIVGVDQFPAYGLLQEWWDMARASNLVQFQHALQALQIPMFTVIYADRDGHIMSLFNGEVPVQPQGSWDFWSGVVPGNTSQTLWTKLYPYSALPKVIDPPAGWVQNSNSPPWWTTYPSVLNPNAYPPSFAPRVLTFREQRGIHMLRQDASISYQHMIEDKFSTRIELADRILDDLVTATQQYGTPLAKQAASVLSHWDRQTNADSHGAALFLFWFKGMMQHYKAFSQMFAVPQDEQHILTTPRGLASPKLAAQVLDEAARNLQSATGSLDVPWGALFRLRRGKIDLPAQGGPGDPLGIFRALYSVRDKDGRFTAIDGDSFIYAVTFTQPLQARALVTYGNASQPDSPHYGDQLKLYATNQLRPVWRTRAEISAHLEMRELV